ncbi:hypothetical protein MIR68_012446 [Amoeboaphelidium protococcarum]|nr:hypothetical protein MIR68_012446 [Amoeboaphelidium protococcarum]
MVNFTINMYPEDDQLLLKVVQYELNGEGIDRVQSGDMQDVLIRYLSSFSDDPNHRQCSFKDLKKYLPFIKEKDFEMGAQQSLNPRLKLLLWNIIVDKFVPTVSQRSNAIAVDKLDALKQWAAECTGEKTIHLTSFSYDSVARLISFVDSDALDYSVFKQCSMGQDENVAPLQIDSHGWLNISSRDESRSVKMQRLGLINQALQKLAIPLQVVLNGNELLENDDKFVITLLSYLYKCHVHKKHRSIDQALLKSTIMLQSLVRMKIATREYQSRKKYAMIIQKWWRRYLLRRAFIDCVYAAVERRQQALNYSATLIQKTWRMYQVRSDYDKTLYATLFMQRRWKYIKRRQQILHSKLQMLKRAIASKIIEYHCVKYVNKRREQILKDIIQSQKQHRAAQVIQWHGKRYISLARLLRENAAATKIQSVWRMHNERQRYLVLIQTIRQLQVKIRSFMLKRKVAARLITAECRRFLSTRRQLALHQSATIVQKYWRGYQVRSHLSPVQFDIFHRLQRLDPGSGKSSQTLGVKAQLALCRISKCQQLTGMLHALQYLNRAASISGECCKQLLQFEPSAVDVLLKAMMECNRSPPHVLLLDSIVSILQNVSSRRDIRHSLYRRVDLFSSLCHVIITYYNQQFAIQGCQILEVYAQFPYEVAQIRQNEHKHILQLQQTCNMLQKRKRQQDEEVIISIQKVLKVFKS